MSPLYYHVWRTEPELALRSSGEWVVRERGDRSAGADNVASGLCSASVCTHTTMGTWWQTVLDEWLHGEG